jgi:hypothetical protein
VIFEDIKRVASNPEQIQQEAAMLACSQSNYPAAKELLNAHPQIKQRIEVGELSWLSVGLKNFELQ